MAAGRVRTLLPYPAAVACRRPRLELLGRPHGAVVLRRPRAQPPPPARGSPAAARAAPPAAASARPSHRGAIRTPTPAQSTRAAFSFMSPPAGHATTAQPAASARTSVPWPAWSTTTSHSGIVFEYDSHGTSTALSGTVIGSFGSRPLYVAITRTGAPARPSSAARSRECEGSCEVEGATSTTGPLPRRRVDALARRLPLQRADHLHPRLPVARVLELRQRPHQRQLARQRGVHERQRLQPQPPPRLVVLVAPFLQRPLHEAPVAPAPQRPARRGPRQPRADRVDRVAVGDERVDVRHERRQRHALELRGQRRAGREDVGDRDVGRERSARTAGSRAPPAPPPRRASAACPAWGRPGTRAPR